MTETLIHRIREFVEAIPPISQDRKNEFLDIVRSRVSYYQPRIEDGCDVELGRIDVRDYKEKYRHLCRVVIDEYFCEGGLVDKIDAVLLWTGMQALRPVLSPIFGQIKKSYMSYVDSTIYIPFNLRSRVRDGDFREREEDVDQEVVHELSHRLWEVLSGENVARGHYGRSKKLWVEGFASYCDSVHFLDFYPESYELFEHQDEFYGDGKNKIKELVDRYGKEIVLEIPSRWEEFRK